MGFKNKQGEDGVVVRNKARLVAQASKGFKLFQMDVKSAFLNGFIEEEVYIYVDDIIFGGSSHALYSKFSEQMSREFEMSMMGELQFFLGL
ncbi:hypothetical protein U9M48_039451 [Paspalum notatum var. saurae]|uniref:Reverse transcriptase Ty1/copia-type domain-containing protein n=1 Tax=Paspalum notatum var. saurae TaxID=547442 RepID=A0AAQ3XD73_PASNO